jgi:hypothetical protein
LTIPHHLPGSSLGLQNVIDMLLQYRQPDGNPEWAERVIQAAKRGWDDNRNPIYVCVAFREARAAQLPIPEWVLEHFDRAMEEINTLWTDPPPAKKINAAVAAAFGFSVKSGPSLFTQAKDPKWIYLGHLVWAQVQQGHSEYNAKMYVAVQERANFSTVDRAWTRYKRVYSPSL